MSRTQSVCPVNLCRTKPSLDHTIINLSADPLIISPLDKSATHHTAAV